MKYGFIGCGNMGSAVVKALCKSTNDIAVTDRTGKAAAFANEQGIVYLSAQAIAEQCDILFLCVKPHMMREALQPLCSTLEVKKPMLVSMAAGLTMETIASLAGCSLPVIRMMPNTPTAVGKGMIQYCRNDLVTDSMLCDWLADMQHCGTLDELEEHLIDAASALSGSGPAYMYLLLEALADGAVACGISRSKAMQYAAVTMAGAAEMYLQTGIHPGALKDAVCSPGGSTIAGIRVLEAQGFRGAAMDCVVAAYQRNRELGNV